ncbi:MAG: hypothetical protein CVU87_09735 [Firmicutes bacterium HGW-Firmicutes-12]|nr:MAG: hypothetical protein CVU87_09735 [Firmicutes bacterium HGW-Firmicutes-12]
MRGNSVIVIFQFAFTFVGTVIGAGFASGQEIVRFFVIFGKKGVLGTITAGVMFAILGAMIVKAVSEENIVDYKQYIHYLFNGRFLGFFDVLLAIFLSCGLVVMLVASGSLFTNILSVPSWVGFYVTGIFVYLTLLMGEEGILWLNTALVPGIVILILIVGGCASLGINETSGIILKEKEIITNSWFFSSLLYVAYNLVLGMVVVASLGGKPADVNLYGIILGGIFLGLMATVICYALLIQGSEIIGEEIPMLVLAGKVSTIALWIYSFVLWAAILTSAVGNGFGLIKRLQSRFAWPKPLLALLVLLPSLPFVGWQLSSAVGTIYPLLGYSGLIFLAAIIYKFIVTWFKDNDF